MGAAQVGGTLHGLKPLAVCARPSFGTIARPTKAGVFSGKQAHRGKSQHPVAWVAAVEETNLLKPTDKAIARVVSESPGRNASEPTGGLVKKEAPEAEPSMVGRRQHGSSHAD